MNRRDAIKAAVAGVAAAMVPAVDSAAGIPAIGTPYNGPVLLSIEGYHHHGKGKPLFDLFMNFSDGSSGHVLTDRMAIHWLHSLPGATKEQCMRTVMEGHTFWHRANDGGRWTPVSEA